jgi:hypothetical protein
MNCCYKILVANMTSFPESWLRLAVNTTCREYDLSWIRLVVNTTCREYDLSWLQLYSSAHRPPSWEVGSSMESSGLCLQYFIGMGNFPQNCQWIKLENGNFENIEFGNRFITLASYGKSKMFVDGHLEHRCSFPKMGMPTLWQTLERSF